jgi:hypothetical protein
VERLLLKAASDDGGGVQNFQLYIQWLCAVTIATGYGLDNWVVGDRVPVLSSKLIPPYCPDGLWGPSFLLSN